MDKETALEIQELAAQINSIAIVAELARNEDIDTNTIAPVFRVIERLSGEIKKRTIKRKI